jgi:Uma2 family endonuclease
MGLPARKFDQRYTYRDYCSWPDDERWELIDGVAWNMSPAPARRHQGITVELEHQIRSFFGDGPCRMYHAPFDVLLPDSDDEEDDEVVNVVQPDILVVCDPAKLNEKGCRGAPDWIIEILSPSTSKKDLAEKHNLYERHGVREYWVVDPGNAFVLTFLLGADGRYGDGIVHEREKTVACAVLPGCSIDLARIFARAG